MAKVRMVVLMISLIFLFKFILVASGEEITYCVTPTENSTCLDQNCQQCKTLGYYIENINDTINKYSNVTMVFLRGYHKICQSLIAIASSSVTMIGEGENVTVQGQHSTINFRNGIHVKIESIVITETNLEFGSKSPVAQLLTFQFVSMKLSFSEVTARIPVHSNASFEYTGCTLQNGRLSITSANHNYRSTNLTITNSKFLNNSISVAICIINISGVSEFIGAQTSAISSYDSAIILSGKVLFENNIATRGGAMALHT